MKKQTLVIIIALIATMSMYGCSKADIETESVVIEDTYGGQIIKANAAGNRDNNTNESGVNENASNLEDINIENTDAKDTDSKKVPDSNTSKNNTDTSDDKSNSSHKANANTTKETNKSKDNSTSLTIEIEGMKETVEGTYFNNNLLDYNIIYDKSKFKHSSSEGSDSFMANNPDPEIYPYVYLNISRTQDTTLDKFSKEMKQGLSHGYSSVEQLPKTTIGDNYDAIHIIAKTGNKWNSSVRELYMIESNNSIYLVEMQYFTEAAEGYGARIHAMIDTFKIK